MNKSLHNTFQSPGAEFRGKPFWAWNGKLEEPELRRQIRIMKAMGLGGFFMHSRVGLATPYLSDEWHRLVGACIDEAEKCGTEAWLYDEDRWPSGAAGGLVTRNPRHRMRYLTLEERKAPAALKWSGDILAAFTATVALEKASNVRPVKRGRQPRLRKGESLLIFTVVPEPCISWYNGYTYLDTMNPEAVREFIRVTHDAYAKRFRPHFGKRVPGIFTDEPNYGSIMAGRMNESWTDPQCNRTPWTGRLPAVFRKRYGYDILQRLPELFFDVDGRTINAVRWHYVDCITHLFVQAFSRQIGEWCGRHNLLFTGHALMEGTPMNQTQYVGSCMRFYEYMQAPGMDLLTEHWREYDTAKQVSSVANQFGQKWRLSETYGCTGWDFPFAGHKALGDWQVALGINLRAQHLTWFTMEGEAKRDYPACIGYQSPWWTLHRKVEDYYARVHAVMTRGREVRDVLVIHPVESVWTQIRRGWTTSQPLQDFEHRTWQLRERLLQNQMDFDYGDEELMSRHAKVVRQDGVPVFKIGRARYRAVVVPPLITIRKTTLALLAEFRRAGGMVVFAGDPPAHVNAEPSDKARTIAALCAQAPENSPELFRLLERTGRRIAVTDGERGGAVQPALYLLREDNEASYLFVCNTGHHAAQLRQQFNKPVHDVLARERTRAFADVRIRGFAGHAGQPQEWDAETGAVYASGALRLPSGEWELRTSLPALGSRLFVIPKKDGKDKLPARMKFRDTSVRRLQPAGHRWTAALSEPNVLVLDRPRYRIDRGAWQTETEILKTDQAVRTALGVPHRGGHMVQPWAREKKAELKSVSLELLYTFEVRTLPTTELALALEHPERFRIAVNGQALSPDDASGWWTDMSLRRLSFEPGLLKPGKNEVRLSCDYTEEHGLEIIYLLGDFGVTVKGTATALIAPSRTLKVGDWTRQGLPFYSGNVAYRTTIRPPVRKNVRTFVRVPAYRGVAVQVRVDGRSAGVIGWEPNEVDITDFLGRQSAVLEIEVLGHRRNSHGPLHHAEKWPVWTGPGEFVSTGQAWKDDYQLVPCGLMKPPEIVLKK